jgi:hypothetical protein
MKKTTKRPVKPRELYKIATTKKHLRLHMIEGGEP